MPRGVATPPDVRERVLSMFAAGTAQVVIAETLGVHEATVNGFVRRAYPGSARPRHYRGRKPYTAKKWASRPNADQIDAAILARYRKEGPGPLAAEFGLTLGSVAARAKRLGTKCETSHARRLTTLTAANETVRQDYFDTWSPNMAWMLGYIWADGTVSHKKNDNRLGFKCTESDEPLIAAIHQDLGSTAPIIKRPSTLMRGGYVGKAQVGFRVSSVRLVARLVDLGIPPRKSFIDPPPPDVPSEFLPHFVRGAIDGDGTICRKGDGAFCIILVGSHRFIDHLAAAISTAAGVRVPTISKTTTSHRLSRIAWYSRSDVRKVAEWLYPPGEYLCLERKRATAMLAIAVAAARNPPAGSLF